MLCPVEPRRPRGARGDLRAGRGRDPVPRRGGGDRARQRHDLRPVGLDLDARRRARRCAWRARSRPACCRSTRTPRCGCRRRSAASSSPATGASSGPHALDALHRGEVRLLRDGGLMGRLDGQGLRDHRRGERHRRRDRAAVPRRGRDASSASTCATTRAGDLALACDVADEDAVRDDVRARARASTAASTCCSTTPASPPTDDVSVLDTSLEAWQRVQDVNLKSVFLCCKHGIPHLLEAGGGSVINTASFVAVMGAATSQISYTASKGARAGAVARARRRVRPPRRARQRALPRPGQHAAAAGALREGPGEGRAPARAPADGPLRRGARDRQRRRCSWPRDESRYVTASTFLVDGGLSGAT